MAQNEVQKYYTDQDFYNGVRQPLTTFYGNMDKLQQMANFLNSASGADYPSVPAGTLTELGELRTQINSFLAAAETISMINKVKDFIRI